MPQIILIYRNYKEFQKLNTKEIKLSIDKGINGLHRQYSNKKI